MAKVTELLHLGEWEELRSANANKNNNVSKWFSRILAKNLSADNKKGYASLRLFKLFVYLEYMLLYLRNRLNDDKK